MKSSRAEQKVLLLIGPTGVGKTELLIRLLPGLGEVISADAMQVYRGLDIGTAKPTIEMRQKVPHHLVDIIDPEESFSVAEFVHQSQQAISKIHWKNSLPVISGGTAFYIKSWLFGLPETPPANLQIRARLQQQWHDIDNQKLHLELSHIDPESARQISTNDRYRILRALEIFEQTHRKLSDFPIPRNMRSDYDIRILGLTMERSILNKRIEQRIKEMLHNGLAEEVEKLKRRGITADSPGMRAIGYREWFDINKNIELVESAIVVNSKRYAKRQMTFLKALPSVNWFDASEESRQKELEKEMKQFLAT